jgi:plastocyanin
MTRLLLAFGLALPFVGGGAEAVEPGVDIATPRVTIVTLNNTIVFIPAFQVVETGDHVRWQVAPGTTLGHTTTSFTAAEVCGFTDGLWDATLNSVTPRFTRQFNDEPGEYPYFCRPHCLNNMRGNVTVTPLIVVTATASPGILTLTWSGGGGSYQVFRSGSPSFPAPLASMPPNGGATGTSFTDFLQPDLNSALYYLVMNK